MTRSILNLTLALSLLLASACTFARPELDTSALNELIKKDQGPALRKAIAQRSKTDIDVAGQSRLMANAISYRRADAVAALLDWGVDVNRPLVFVVDGEKLSTAPLSLAVSGKAGLPVVELLIKRGANPNPKNESLLPLNFALASRQYDVADFLIGHGADPQAATVLRPLMELVLSSEEADGATLTALMEKLIARGADINAQSGHGTTALSVAVGRGKVYAVKALLEHGANPNTVDARGDAMLSVATRKGSNDIAQLLAKAGAKPPQPAH